MQAILMAFAICLLGVMVTVLLFSLAMGLEQDEDEVQPSAANQLPPGQFFLDEALQAAAEPGAPTNSILLQLEQHVRKEQQAAEEFLQGPSPESLHKPSDSPFWQ